MFPPSMTFAELKPFQAVLEVRYADAFSLWDRAGMLWTRLAKKYENLERIQAQPTETIFRLGKSFELAAKLDGASVVAFKPEKNLTEFIQLTDVFFRIVAEILEISAYNRVGCRLIFTKDFSSIQAASAAILATGLLKWPEGQQFSKTGTPVQPEWALRWEDENRGVHLRLRVDERKYEIKPPLVWEGKYESTTSTEVSWDVDWYTRKRVLVTQMSYSEFIGQCVHAVRRDSDHFLGGL